MTSKAQSDAERPWHANFPAPKSTAGSMSREQLLGLLQDQKKLPGRDFLLVDLRRTDHEGGTIRGSLNLPAQSLWYSLESLYGLCKAAGVSVVAFYCGSSRGRGTRAAGWFQDVLEHRGETVMKSLVLAGGINGWFEAGGDYAKFVDGNEKD
ncbi:related to arsenate reductase (Arc2) [Ramularia collo-cygni]|uniref:Related to arsenate reductase (Arc2) n=1 Tax=Ramularia collo-cygni TaxID=112498 RepID=A0A2D3VB06_9PEZI|nr:related to arsenate reductase (Arc2) [Ramularia collo-cygni]CZT24140.1 related to arsenate reductase (Arc2) [Ramularia collo-cygni]